MATPGPWREERPIPDRGYMDTGSAWIGWLQFAGVMMILVGAFNLIAGLTALLKDDFFVVTKKHLLLFDFTTWGWALLILGLLVVFAGFAVMAGRTWGRVLGVILAGLNALGQLSFADAQPLWSIIVIGIDVIVIYALVVHGREMATE